MKIQLNIGEIIKGSDTEGKAPKRVYWIMMALIMPHFLRELLQHVFFQKLPQKIGNIYHVAILIKIQ